MELIERYLQAVRKHLPWKRQDDIIAELRANLESQLEDKEAELGRPLTAGEAEAWLQQIGSPRRMAAPYCPQRYLIGPTLYPVFWLVMLTVFLWVMIIHVFGSAVQIATGSPSWSAVLDAVRSVPGILLMNGAWVVLIFAVIEFAVHARSKSNASAPDSSDWSPSDLPPVQNESTGGQKPRSYACAMVETMFGVLFLVWLLLLPKYPYLLLGPGAAFPHSSGANVSPFRLAPVWSQVYWCVLVLNLIQLGWNCRDLLCGAWRAPKPSRRIALSVLGLVPLGLLLAARDRSWVTLKDPALDGARYGAALDAINHALYVVFVILCTIFVLRLVWIIGRICLDSFRRRAAAQQ
jgi:hypothetical protein